MPRFSGSPKTEWLTERGVDRSMKLLDDFWFEDRAAKVWTAGKDAKVDGASIPRALWTLVGSPYTGCYRRASIVHDVACKQSATPAMRSAADRMFYEAAREGGCTVVEATILYLGVRVGAHWPAATPFFSESIAGIRPKLVDTIQDRKLKADFQTIVDDILFQPESDDPFEIELRANHALNRVVAFDYRLYLAAEDMVLPE